ncbi:MAG: hypothetical protein ACREWG_13140, partial [Gammaproteobacteria bacterium]
HRRGRGETQALARGLVLLVACTLHPALLFAQTTAPPAPPAPVRSVIRVLDETLETPRAVLRQWAADAALPDMLGKGPPEAITSREAEFAEAMPGTLRVRLLQGRDIRADLDADPPFAYASVDAMRSAAKSDDPIPAEVVLPGDPRQHLVLIERVKGSSGDLVGFIHLSLSLGLLEATSKSVPPLDGYIELQPAAFGASPAILAKYGDRRYKHGQSASRTRVPGTRWVLAYWPSLNAAERYLAGLDTPRDAAGETAGSAWVVWLTAALLLVFTGVAFLYRQRLAALLANARRPKAPLSPSAVAAAEQGAEPAVPPPPAPVENAPEPAPLVPVVETMPQSEPIVATAPLVPGTEVEFAEDRVVGSVGEGLSEELIEILGQIFASLARDQGHTEIVVARDARASSPALAAALVRGIRAAGGGVIDIGSVPTPVAFFASHYLHTGAAAVVSGGARPDPYNGLQAFLHELGSAAATLAQLRKRIGTLHKAAEGTLQEAEIGYAYIEAVTQDIPLAFPRTLKVAVDAGGGVAATLAPALLRALGHEVVEIDCEIDANLPYRPVDLGSAAELGALVAAVRENQADLGVRFDGDGRHCAVLDAAGAFVTPKHLASIWASEALARTPGGRVLLDADWIGELRGLIEAMGGTPVALQPAATVEQQLYQSDALFAVGTGGEAAFRDRWYGFSDALYAVVRLLEVIVAREDRSVAALVAEIEGR